MPRDLTTAEITALKKEGLTRVSQGLYIQIRGGSRTWLLRYRFRGRHQLMSIGPVRLIKLTEAKHRALAAQVFARSAETKALAFDHLAAAQDYVEAFQRVKNRDRQLAWRYKSAEAIALIDHGNYKGDNAALERAIEAGTQSLELTSREAAPLDWAPTQNNLGTALTTLGQRESGTARLEEAVAAYRAALEERTRERVPLDWAMTQSNLGAALHTLGQRESGTARLKEAVTAYRAALEERTRERVPLQWAMTQSNLGGALTEIGRRTGRRADIEEGRAAIMAAWDVFREVGYVQYDDYFRQRIKAADTLLAALE